MPLPDSTDWLGFCRRAAAAARDAVHAFASTAERGVETGRGEGGDTAYAIDRAAEDAIFREIDALGVSLCAVSEERGEVPIGPTAGNEGELVRVVIDPVDGSLNAKRGLPFACVSIAVASGPRMGDVEVGWVAELDPRLSAADQPRAGRDWWAVKGGGAFRDGEPLPPLRPGPLEVLGIETARPELVAAAATAIQSVEARRIRALGSVAMTLCLVAAGQLDAMLSLRPIRSVDAAAAQLLVTEAGGAVAFPQADELTLEMRSPVLAARDTELLARLSRTFA
ncbi:MAG TPA: inositol monophosphatase family protein [Thermoleophilaceae bacterium]|nr:inositol monophosphatase family protein [Thermoleophilaceae bacterium]